jgi:hypothetical protein
LSDFIERRVKTALVAREIALVDRAARASPPRWDPDEFSVRGSAAAGGEVAAVFTRDEARIELRVRLPPAYPLVNAEVDCAGKSGVKDARWRRWVLQVLLPPRLSHSPLSRPVFDSRVLCVLLSCRSCSCWRRTMARSWTPCCCGRYSRPTT